MIELVAPAIDIPEREVEAFIRRHRPYSCKPLTGRQNEGVLFDFPSVANLAIGMSAAPTILCCGIDMAFPRDVLEELDDMPNDKMFFFRIRNRSRWGEMIAPAAAASRQVWDSLRGFDERMGHGWGYYDWDLYTRAKDLGIARISYHPVYHVEHKPRPWQTRSRREREAAFQSNKAVVLNSGKWGRA